MTHFFVENKYEDRANPNRSLFNTQMTIFNLYIV